MLENEALDEGLPDRKILMDQVLEELKVDPKVMPRAVEKSSGTEFQTAGEMAQV